MAPVPSASDSHLLRCMVIESPVRHTMCVELALCLVTENISKTRGAVLHFYFREMPLELIEGTTACRIYSVQ